MKINPGKSHRNGISLWLLAVLLFSPLWAVGQELAATNAKDNATPALERLENGDVRLGRILLDVSEKCLRFPAKIELRKGPIEVLISTPVGRLHEALLNTEAGAMHLQVMLYLLGLRNGARLPGGEVEQGDKVDIFLEWQGADGTTENIPVERFLLDRRTNDSASSQGWVFVGSSVQAGELLAETEGNIALTWSQGQTILDTADPEGGDDTLFTAYTERLESIPSDSELTVVIRRHVSK